MFHKKLQIELYYHEKKLNNDFSNTIFNKAITIESIKQQSNDHFLFHDISHVHLFTVNFMGKLSHS